MALSQDTDKGPRRVAAHCQRRRVPPSAVMPQTQAAQTTQKHATLRPDDRDGRILPLGKAAGLPASSAANHKGWRGHREGGPPGAQPASHTSSHGRGRQAQDPGAAHDPHRGDRVAGGCIGQNALYSSNPGTPLHVN